MVVEIGCGSRPRVGNASELVVSNNLGLNSLAPCIGGGYGGYLRFPTRCYCLLALDRTFESTLVATASACSLLSRARMSRMTRLGDFLQV